MCSRSLRNGCVKPSFFHCTKAKMLCGIEEGESA